MSASSGSTEQNGKEGRASGGGDPPVAPSVAQAAAPVLRRLGRGIDYVATFDAMRAFTDARTPATPDEIWLCEHPPVYTLGLAGRAEHVLDTAGIPVVRTNRGGQVTYHGPGQVVAYPLIDLQRLGIYIKEYVFRVEEAVLRTLAHFGVTGHRVAGAPGLYVRLDDPSGHAVLGHYGAAAMVAAAASGPDFTGLGKIAALGIKVSRHCTYHGVALNVAMELRPFDGINACGYPGLRTVDLSTIGVPVAWDEAADVLGRQLATWLAP